jgi:hypothetical protein
MRSASPSGSDGDPPADPDRDPLVSASEFDIVFGDDLGFAVDPVTEAAQLSAYDVLRLRANNSGPLTLSGTNTWVVDRNPT